MDDGELFNRYRALLGISAKFHEDNSNSQLAAMFNQAQGRLRDLLQRRANPSPVVAFVGLTNVGKSTLMSALFGAKVAPMKNRAWSSVPVEYRYGEKYEASADFSNSIMSETRVFQNADELLEFISTYATAGGMQNVSELHAKMPSELLRSGLVVADTPGFGAATAAGGSLHEESVKKYLEKRADYVFWVISFQPGITKSELNFYDNFLAGHCENIVVNCRDKVSEKDKRNIERTNGKQLKVRMNWHFVDAKTALEGKLKGNDDKVKESGIAAFEREIQALGPTEKRLADLDKELMQFPDNVRQFRNRTNVQMFFAEHVRLGLELALRKCEPTPLVTSMLKSIER